MQVQRARPRSKQSANAVKTRKRKIVARSAEDEATSLTNNRHVHTAGTPIIQTILDGSLRMKSMSVKEGHIKKNCGESRVCFSGSVKEEK